MSSDTSFLRNSILSGILKNNCLFIVTVLIGLALNPGNTIHLNSDPSCTLEPSYAQNVVIFHAYSIICFLFSTLIALVLKKVTVQKSPSDHILHLLVIEGLEPVYKSWPIVETVFNPVPSVVSACGCVFMALASISVVEMKLGACSFEHSMAPIVPLTLLLPMAHIIYLFPVVYAFTRY